MRDPVEEKSAALRATLNFDSRLALACKVEKWARRWNAVAPADLVVREYQSSVRRTRTPKAALYLDITIHCCNVSTFRHYHAI